VKACTVVPGQLASARVDEVADPPEQDGEILVEGLYVGVCGTDMEITEKGYGQPPPGRDRLTLFHESLGRVLDAPAGSGFARGDLVAGIVRRPDPVPCPCCAQDQWDFCRNGQYTERGIKGHDGYGSTRWRVPPKFAVKLDPQLDRLGVLLEPTSVVAKAWDQTERIGARACFVPQHVLVTGAGPIGLLAALIGVQKNLDVHVFDRVTDGPKPGLVADLGATYHASLDSLTVAPDIVIEATGIGSLVFDLVQRTGPDAIVCLTGISSGTRSIAAELDAVNKEIVLRNEVVFGSVNAGRRHYEQAADALRRADRGWLSRLISRTVPMASWPQVFDRQPDDVKVVVDLQGAPGE
jgi:threonine dehydrogenase-like Zn-dependent dehydrogenase